MFKAYFLAFVPLFVAVDALGMIPVYISLTEGMRSEDKSRLVKHSVLVALAVALSFLFIGKLVFLWLGVTINDFLVAGGTILFVISIRDLLSTGKSARSAEAVGVVPLAVPLIVGPAVLTTSLIVLDAHGALPTVFAIVVNILLCGAVLLAAHRLSALLGEAGSQTLSKVFNLLLAAIGIMLVRRGLFAMVGV
jgi:multiple antibiotic resistance protein